MSYYYGFKPYVSVAKRQANAAKHVAKLAKQGRTITPIKVAGTKIAKTFWGKAWCENLEAYSDYSNRLPRGRRYVRNGSVVDLQVEAGRVTAIVSGSSLYNIEINIKPLQAAVWSCLKRECGGKIGSLVELLKGQLSQGVMAQVTNADKGLFPKPAEIEMDCSCPDGAYMCKHLAAVLYGVGALLDQRPELLFALRKVDHLELIAEAAVPAIPQGDASRPAIAAGDLADVFGIELDASVDFPAPAHSAKNPPAAPKRARGVVRKGATETTKSRKKNPPELKPAPGKVEKKAKSKRMASSIAPSVTARTAAKRKIAL